MYVSKCDINIDMDTIYLFVVASIIGISEAGECHVNDRDDLFGSGYYEYCAFGCCGFTAWYEGDSVCCSAVGPIIGIVIGSGCFIGVVAAIVCCCVKKRGNAGTVFGPGQRTGGVATTTVVTASAAQPQYQGMYPGQTYSAQPAGYQQPSGYTAGYQQPMGYQQHYPPQPQQPYPQPPQPQPMGPVETTYTAPYPPTAQAGYVQSPNTGYSQKPESKASAPPMDEPPPYPYQ